MGKGEVPKPWQDVLDAWEGWLKAGGSPATTIEQRLYQLRRFAGDHPSLSPWEIELDHLVHWLAAQQWKPNTLRAYRGGLRAFYAWAVAVGWLAESPAAPLPRIKTTRGLPRPVPEDVLRTAVAAAGDRPRLMLLLAAYGGLRRAEVAKVRREDAWRDDGGGWWLRVHGKGDAYRDVPLTGHLAAAILSQPPGWLFPSPTRHGDHLTPAHVGVVTSRLLPPGWSLHTLRHRFATRVRAQGADIYVIAELLGHRNIDTTRIYTRLGHDELRRAVDGAA